MGETAIAFWEWFRSAFLLDKVYHKLLSYLDFIPDSVKNFYYENRILCYMVAIAGLFLLAFEGYKLFKLGLYVLTGAGFGYATYALVGPYAEQVLSDKLPEIIDIKVVCGFVVGLIFVLITKFLYKFIVMIIGLGCGYLFGYVYVWRVLVANFPTLQFVQTPTARYIIGFIFGAFAALIFLFVFKHAVIIGTGVGCPVFAAYLASKILVPGGDASVKICFMVLGAAVAVFATVRQYREEERAVSII